MSDIKIPEVKAPQHLGTGRRKSAVARVRLAVGTGKILVNGRPFENYFPTESLRVVAAQPLTVTGFGRQVRRANHRQRRRPDRPGRAPCGMASPARCSPWTSICGPC